jgi:hypothetical protein
VIVSLALIAFLIAAFVRRARVGAGIAEAGA